jgi:multiple sugar transport system ATP-binding protein
MTVYDNMAFGLKLRKMPRAEIDARVKEAARILGLETYLQRKPKALSGGQRQRVALGRAIVREPKVFLLDEPLSNLDAKLRSQMRTEITKLHNRLATTFIYVTHDQVEAMTMGTRIVVMKDGFMQQVDTPINLYDYPINQFVAGFIGTPQMNFFQGVLTGTPKQVYVEFGLEKIALPKEKSELIVGLDKYLNTGRPIVFGIRPEDIHDEEMWLKNSKLPQIEIGVDVVEALGSETIVYGKTRREETGDNSLQRSLEEDKSNVTAKVDSRSTTKAGDKIKIALDIIHCHLFDAENELTILARSLEHKAEIEAMQNQYDSMMSENPTDFVVEYTEEDPEGSIEKAVPQDSKKKKK